MRIVQSRFLSGEDLRLQRISSPLALLSVGCYSRSYIKSWVEPMPTCLPGQGGDAKCRCGPDQGNQAGQPSASEGFCFLA
jgi:hypothetical protein